MNTDLAVGNIKDILHDIYNKVIFLLEIQIVVDIKHSLAVILLSQVFLAFGYYQFKKM